MKDSPFSLNFGLEPNNYIERYEEKEQIIDDFSRENPVSYSYLVIGPRGSGKTVFMTNVSAYFQKKDDWISVDPGIKADILPNLAAMLYEKGRLKKLFAKAEFSFSFQGLGISIKGEKPVSSVIGLLEKMFEYLKSKGKKILITIDEVDNSREMVDFISAYQYFLRQKYGIRLLMTGLYENVSALKDNKSITFLYRCPSFFLGPLSISAISGKYEELLGANEDEALALAKETKGFAFAYQLLGSLCFDNGLKALNPSLLRAYDEGLAKYVYDKIFSDCSGSEKQILLTFRDMKAKKTSAICAETGFSAKYLGVYRDKLIKKGILLSPRQGYLALALPRFDRFLAYQDSDLLF